MNFQMIHQYNVTLTEDSSSLYNFSIITCKAYAVRILLVMSISVGCSTGINVAEAFVLLSIIDSFFQLMKLSVSSGS